jgi:hypothetical protein
MIGSAGILGGGVYGALRRGLVAEYLFASDARDTSGEGNNGTLTNGATVSSGILVLDGANDYVSVPDAPELRVDQFSIVAWVRPSTPGTADRTVAAKFGGGTINKRGFLLYALYSASPQAWAIQVATDGAGTNSSQYRFGVPPGSGWAHVVATWDRTQSAGQRGKLYVNGASQATTSIPFDAGVGAAPFGSDVAFTIGAILTNPSPTAALPWKGDLDDVDLYNRVLTAAEALTLYNLRPDLH